MSLNSQLGSLCFNHGNRGHFSGVDPDPDSQRNFILATELLTRLCLRQELPQLSLMLVNGGFHLGRLCFSHGNSRHPPPDSGLHFRQERITWPRNTLSSAMLDVSLSILQVFPRRVTSSIVRSSLQRQ